MFVMGVNDDAVKSRSQQLFPMSSCTTNCLAPVAKVLDDNFGIEEGLNDYECTQQLQHNLQLTDHLVKDYRGGRSAALLQYYSCINRGSKSCW